MTREYSPRFIEYMINRTVTGAAKHGGIKKARFKVNFLANIKLRVDEYKKTGNTEFLVDAANFCMLEFMEPSIPNAKFQGTDGKGPGVILLGSSRPVRRFR